MGGKGEERARRRGGKRKGERGKGKGEKEEGEGVRREREEGGGNCSPSATSPKSAKHRFSQ